MNRRLPVRHSRGVTLIELVVVIALVGILGALIVNFIAPVRSYIDTTRRAALADAADTALRRIGRDLHLALPNSVRVASAGGVSHIELLLVRTAGRYRIDSGGTNHCGGGATDDPLTFGSSDTCFMTIGSTPNLAQVTTSDYVVVFNLQPGTDKADAYQTSCATACNKSHTSPVPTAFAGEDKIEFAGNTFTYESPGNRFFIIEGAVSYVCDPTAGTLTRRWGYTPTSGATATTAFGGGSSALMASGVSGCSFSYDAVSQGAGLANLQLTLSTTDSRGNAESVALYHAVHVNNIP
ncbi:MAG TPA: prepilin-type N-terminal cleavage/methylation domain-containing protein [Burkholderiales bacterium]|jgi:MSHA biogenesis protein MshO|nr:prepilin-type N-terminal cleavage/methylation domain-containing protein [Burkholderiales bacterium]